MSRTKELRSVAQRVAEALPPLAGDVVLTGSTSRGVADEMSDVELLAVVDELPPLEDCIGHDEDAGLTEVETWLPPHGQVYWTGGYAGGEYVEVLWWPRAFLEERLRGILAAEIVDHERVRTAEAIANGIALRGEELERWQARLAAYPEALAAAIVDAAAETWHDPPRSERAFLRAGDTFVLAKRLVEEAENAIRIVFALNRTWEPGWKRIALVLEHVERKPERLVERLDDALRALDLRAMQTLVGDTLALAPATPSVLKAREQVAAFLA